MTEKTSSVDLTKAVFVNPYAVTAQNLEGLRIDEQELAGRDARFFAAMIDIFCWFGLAMVAGIMVVVLPKDASMPVVMMSTIVALFILLVALQLIFVIRYAQSIGKRIMKIRVVRMSTGEQCGAARYIFLRTMATDLIGAVPLFGSIFSLVDVLMIFADDRRCLHDRLADTRVVKVRIAK